jgi:hypothetical protein
LEDLPIHQKIFVRARVYTTCDGSGTEDANLAMTMDTQAAVVYPITQNTETIIEDDFAHTGSTFELTIAFGIHGQGCRKMVQDISIYYERCPTHCGSKHCLDAGPYYTHPDIVSCVNDCPDGFNEDGGTGCIPFAFCHSTCADTCNSPNNAAQCSACPTTLSGYLPYDTLATPPGACTLPSANNAQLV